MSYNPINWVNGETPINDTNLNNMDQGIADAHSMLAEHESQIADFVNQQLPEEYVKEAVDAYVENNSAGFATAADLEEIESQLDSVNSEVGELSGEIADEVNNRNIAISSAVETEKLRAMRRENEIEELFAAPTQEAIDEWLNEHPEATTTVQDGSIEDIKFTDTLKLKTLKDYVTPEMFGAKGDGVTDDTNAIVSAISVATQKHCKVCFCGKTYLISNHIAINKVSNLIIEGNQSTIFCDFTGFAFILSGCNRVVINDLKIDCNDKCSGIYFGDYLDTTGDKARNTLTFFNRVVIKNYEYGVKIDSASGYNYFEKCRFTNGIENAIGLSVGENPSDVNISPNYIYVKNCAFEGLDTSNNVGVNITYGSFIFIEGNDFCNFENGVAVRIAQNRYSYNIVVNNNSIFKNGIGVEMSGESDLDYVRLSNNIYRLAGGQSGIVKTSTKYIGYLQIFAETFEPVANIETTPNAFISLKNVRQLTMAHCVGSKITIGNETVYPWSLVTLSNIIDKAISGMQSNCDGYYDINSGESKTIKCGADSDLIRTVTPLVISSDNTITEYTVTRTANADGTCTVVIQNNSGKKLRIVVR